MQFAMNEKPYFEAAFMCVGVIALIVNLTNLKELFTLKFIVATFLIFNLSVLDMSYAHFGQDILYMSGNIMHHADISSFRDESNATFVSMIPQGFALSSFMTFLWAIAVRHVIVGSSPPLKKFVNAPALFLATFIMLAFILKMVKSNHPYMHQIATEEMRHEWPWTFNWRAHQHVFVHLFSCS